MITSFKGTNSVEELFNLARTWDSVPIAELNQEQVAVLNLYQCIQNRPEKKAGGSPGRHFEITLSKRWDKPKITGNSDSNPD